MIRPFPDNATPSSPAPTSLRSGLSVRDFKEAQSPPVDSGLLSIFAATPQRLSPMQSAYAPPHSAILRLDIYYSALPAPPRERLFAASLLMMLPPMRRHFAMRRLFTKQGMI